jgi:catechol 2,3-dioxygenase-like lactoylglutathione lyase family enzyme
MSLGVRRRSRVGMPTDPGADMSDTTTPLVTGTDFITVPTQDIAASEAFYGGLLGLTFSKRWGKMPGAEYETGNLTLALMEPEAFGGEFRKSGTAVALRVDDVAARREELEAKGVTFFGDTIDSGVCFQAFFADPDGNPLILHHRYAPLD